MAEDINLQRTQLVTAIFQTLGTKISPRNVVEELAFQDRHPIFCRSSQSVCGGHSPGPVRLFRHSLGVTGRYFRPSLFFFFGSFSRGKHIDEGSVLPPSLVYRTFLGVEALETLLEHEEAERL